MNKFFELTRIISKLTFSKNNNYKSFIDVTGTFLFVAIYLIIFYTLTDYQKKAQLILSSFIFLNVFMLVGKFIELETTQEITFKSLIFFPISIVNKILVKTVQIFSNIAYLIAILAASYMILNTYNESVYKSLFIICMFIISSISVSQICEYIYFYFFSKKQTFIYLVITFLVLMVNLDNINSPLLVYFGFCMYLLTVFVTVNFINQDNLKNKKENKRNYTVYNKYFEILKYFYSGLKLYKNTFFIAFMMPIYLIFLNILVNENGPMFLILSTFSIIYTNFITKPLLNKIDIFFFLTLHNGKSLTINSVIVKTSVVTFFVLIQWIIINLLGQKINNLLLITSLILLLTVITDLMVINKNRR